MQNDPLPVLAFEMGSNEDKNSENTPPKGTKVGETIMTPEHNRV